VYCVRQVVKTPTIIFNNRVFLKFVHWEPSCSMRTDSHDRPNSHFSEVCEAPNTVRFVTRLKHSNDT